MPVIFTKKDVPDRDENDFYPTPLPFAKAHLDLVKVKSPKRILDIGAGEGVYGTLARAKYPDSWIVGVELDNTHEQSSAYDLMIYQDFSDIPVGSPFGYSGFDLIIGNPPFKLFDYKMMVKCWELLNNKGEISFILPLEYQSTIDRFYLFAEYRPSCIYPFVTRANYTGKPGNTRVDCFYQWIKSKSPNQSTEWNPIFVREPKKRQYKAPANHTITLTEYQYMTED